jgi:hypothetical protein
VRLPDGRWDVFAVLERWRRSSRVGLRASFRERRTRLPWLDPARPLAPADFNALISRAADVGAKFDAAERRKDEGLLAQMKRL